MITKYHDKQCIKLIQARPWQHTMRRPFDEVMKGCSGCKAFLPNLHSFQDATEEQLFQDLGISWVVRDKYT